ncbi:PAS domain S-box-containing protein [Noviherbaspirillum humi]|uniref:histidine kinase n=1 Tax=Noviherbaspirillum humi TaxID=1688639 RepID=A0A239F9J4_9BURK|nr:PAS domain S-box protein [Noviherbaspirillum humi]SNS52973.1 PAS domain S-box-containing protein [Noviherbaspirillum humi]
MPANDHHEALGHVPEAARLLFEGSADCIAFLDAGGCLTALNPQGRRLLQARAESVGAGAGWASLWPSENHDVILGAMRAATEGEGGRCEFFSRHAAGACAWWDMRVTALRDAFGVLQGWMLVARDMTALHEAREKHRRAEAFSQGQKAALELAVAGAELTEVLDLLVRTAEAYSEQALLASVLLLDDEGKRLLTGAGPSLPEAYNRAIDGMMIGPAAGSCGTAAFTAKPVFVRDIRKDPLWADFAELAVGHGLRSCWSYPIKSSKGEVVGTFAFYYRQVRDPVPKEADAMPLLVHTAALVLERHRETREREAAQQALAKSEAKLKRLIDANILGIIEYELDAYGTLKAVNDAFLDTVAYSREEFERDGLSWRALTPPDFIDANRKALEQLQRTGVMETFEKEYLRKDGSRVPVYIGAANFEGSSTQGIAYVLDISKMKEAERALRESEARFRTIANATPQMVWTTFRDGRHDFCNQRWYEFTGLAPGTVDADTWVALVHPDDRASALRDWQHSMASGEPYECEYRFRHHSGEYRWALTRALPVRDEAGAILRWMGTCTDIQEQKSIQDALRLSDQRKDEFLAMLAHELRNPLAPIAAAADLLSIVQPDEARLRQLSEIISRQSRHMTGLIEDLLDVSRVTRGLVTLQRELVPLEAIIASAIEQVRPLMEARGHRLDVAPMDRSLSVAGDRKRLVQIIANLLNNAAKYTGDAGLIELQVGVEGNAVSISIRDNGIGMPPALIEQAFELFTQGERTSDRSQGGLGIGLALVRRLVELHGGTVRAVSEGAGKGSEFIVRLPCERQPAELGGNLSARRAAAGRALRVLVVDDNADAAQMLGFHLEQVGHEVLIEYGAHSALDTACRVAPQVCLLDIGLPQMDGYELARRLRALPGMEQALLVAVTGYGREQDRQAAFAAGFDRHFVKPVNFQEIADCIAGMGSAALPAV